MTPRLPLIFIAVLMTTARAYGQPNTVATQISAPAPIPADGFEEVGGSNYVMYRVDARYRQQYDRSTWYQPGVLQPTIAAYHLQDQAMILGQLRAMHQNGQRKISLMLWYTPFAKKNRGQDLLGHLVDSTGGNLPSLQAQNIRGLLGLIAKTGYFNELIFRFAPQGKATPSEWKRWNEKQYQENWRFLQAARAVVCEALRDSGIRLRFDLSAEGGGLEDPMSDRYARRLWKDYLDANGCADTYGFSVALYPGRVRRLLEEYDAAGERPTVYALDIYDNIESWMGGAIREFRAAGIEHPPIIIQETFYNDAFILKELQTFQREVRYQFLMQWPWSYGWPVPHFSVDYTPHYDAYLETPTK